MPTIRDQAICTRCWDFSETSQTVSLFLREHGMIRGLAKGSRREQGRFSGGIDLLSRGEIVAITKPDRELATLTEWDLQEMYWGLRQSVEANRIGYFMADLVGQFFTDSAPHIAVFDAMADALRTLESANAANALLHFQWIILNEAGYRPRLEVPQDLQGAASLAFSAASGGVVASGSQAGGWRVRRATVDLLAQIATDGAGTVVCEAETVARANRLLAAYIREILHHEPPTMRLVFPDLDRSVPNGEKPGGSG